MDFVVFTLFEKCAYSFYFTHLLRRAFCSASHGYMNHRRKIMISYFMKVANYKVIDKLGKPFIQFIEDKKLVKNLIF